MTGSGSAATATAHREFGTRKVRTRIHGADAMFTWERRRAHRSLVDVTEELVPPRSQGSARLVVGARRGNTFTYRLSGDSSLGEDTLRAWRSGTAGHVARHFAAAGRALLDLAACPASDRPLPPPLGACQIRAWLRRAGSRADGETAARVRLHDALLSTAGKARVRTLEEWADRLVEAPGGQGLLHGEYSVSAMVRDRHGGDMAVFFGETVCRGPIEYDAGWLVGELAEWSDVSQPGVEGTTTGLGGPASSFLRPLSGLDLGLLGRVVVLRRLMHVIDYVSAFGWSDLLDPYVALMPELVDSGGMSTLSRIGWDADVADRLPP
ncbi:phosphotransferase [Streptomyces luteogriseus]|uniref:phosphotransferase n=1 Tax=Streptomyces luteogriseus TaxID=68233 RepID=UPI0036E57096